MRRTLLFLLWIAAVAAPSAGAQAVANPAVGEVALRAGDVVRVYIWREADLSGDFAVNERGTVVLPLLGERTVVGIPMNVLRDTLIASYRVQLRNPSITITPLRRVNVLGEVQRPGLYPVDPTISLSEAVALAGGATPTGDLGQIRVMRGGQVVHEQLDASASLNTVGIRSGDQILIGRRSWLDRNSSALVTTGVSLLGSIVTTLIIISSTR